jgi:hypothetical protein
MFCTRMLSGPAFFSRHFLQGDPSLWRMGPILRVETGRCLWQCLTIMSKGPGRIERALARAVRLSHLRLGQVHVEAADVARVVYGAAVLTRSQRVSVVSGMHRFVRKHWRYALAGGQGRTPLRIIRSDVKAPEAQRMAEARRMALARR